jgi:exopolysaccharide production protein ExoZ
LCGAHAIMRDERTCGLCKLVHERFGGIVSLEPLRDQSPDGSSEATPPPPRPRLDALQGLRGCAALLVVVGHSLVIFRGASGADASNALPDVYGALGVRAFFVVSGFLMIYVHGQDFGQPRATKKFYARRIARIVPLYWAVTILYAVKQIYFGQDTVWHSVKSLFFIPYQATGDLWRPVLGQGWTLNYEMAFYLVFGFALLFSRGVWVVFGVFGTLILLNVSGLFGPHNLLTFWSDPIVLYFLAGVAIGLLRARTNRGPSFAVAFCVALAVPSLAALLAALLNAAPAYVAIALPVAAVSAVGITAFAREDLRLSWVRRLAKHIGDASYSIYLTHTFVIAPAAKIVVAKLFPEMPIAAFILLMIVATAVVGYGVFRFVERPLIKIWTRTFVKRPGAQTTTPAAT